MCGSKISKLWAGEALNSVFTNGKVIYICIFRNSLSNIRTTRYEFFVAECLYDQKFVAARMLLGPDINAASERAK